MRINNRVILAAFALVAALSGSAASHAADSGSPGSGTETSSPQSEPTPLMVAAFEGNEAAVEALLAAGADPTVRDAFGRTALWYSIYGGHLSVFERLIARPGVGDIVNLPDRLSGTTPLHLAAESNVEGFTGPLLEAGADRDARNTIGETPADICDVVFRAGCKGL